MADRRVTDHEVQEAILGPVAEIIEEYPTDKYSPSYLIYGVTDRGAPSTFRRTLTASS